MCKKNSTFVGEINRLLLIENNNGQLGGDDFNTKKY